MTSLIATLGEGKGAMQHLAKLIEEEKWDKIFLVATANAKAQFKCSKSVEYIIIDENKYLSETRDTIRAALKGKIADTEVGLSLIAGSGKLHMAALSAILQSGLAIRLMAVTPNGIQEI